jgi:hypothetical protein
MFKMSYNEAMLIQRAQMVWYRQHIGLRGIRHIRKATKPCPPDVHPDKKISISGINSLVPRGGDFEYMIIRRSKYKNKVLDKTTEAWHDAIRRGLL